LRRRAAPQAEIAGPCHDRWNDRSMPLAIIPPMRQTGSNLILEDSNVV
jgi:hypothetical protein